MNFGVPVFSPTNRKPKYVSQVSNRRDGKRTAMTPRQARKAFASRLAAPATVSTDDLARRAILAQRQMEINAFGKTTIPYPECDEPQYSGPFGGDDLDFDGLPNVAADDDEAYDGRTIQMAMKPDGLRMQTKL